MLHNLQYDTTRLCCALRSLGGGWVFDLQRIPDGGQSLVETNVNDRTDNLSDGSFCHRFEDYTFFRLIFYRIASIPLVISETSRVMAAWRTLLKVRVRPLAMSRALSVALFIATIRAECSEAFDSRSAWNTAILRSLGKRASSTLSGSGSMVYAAGFVSSLAAGEGAYWPLAGRMFAIISLIISGRIGTICRTAGCCSNVEMKFWYATRTLATSSRPRIFRVSSDISLSEMPSLTLVRMLSTVYPREEKYSPPRRPNAYTTTFSLLKFRSRNSLSTFRTTPLFKAPARPLSLVITMSAVFPSRSCMSGWRAMSAVPDKRSSTESAAAAYERPESARSCPLRIFTAETASIAWVTVPVFLYESIFSLMFFSEAIAIPVIRPYAPQSPPLPYSLSRYHGL